MMRERVADNVHVFTSDLYAQVNAGVVVGPEWSLLIDTLAYPDESMEIRDFVERGLGSRVAYIVLTHYHADHSLGTWLFPGAVVIAQREGRRLLDTRGREALAEAQGANRELRDVQIVLPDIVVGDDQVSVRVGRKTLELIPLPGHSPDGLGVLLTEDRVLFSGDAMMPLPSIVDGEISASAESLRKIPRMKLENLVQGHGEVVLRGEIPNAVRSNLAYLAALDRFTRRQQRRKSAGPADANVEDFGKSRILMNGLAGELHRRNLQALLRPAPGHSGR
ncbi:MAG TPA: MBL fold metallo-hydrolase [Anaerolineales bacterium]|nr:MBL fold metallo-hydrolase [Anaerolineales bacterium]